VTTPKKRQKKKYPKALREMAMERLKSCGNVTALSKELGVHRTLLYKWRERMEARESNEGGGAVDTGERKLRAEIGELKRVLAEKALEVDFFKGALQKIEARRQNKAESGEKGSTTKSGS
jgi:transposase-like protein